jgi:hypothetical protein
MHRLAGPHPTSGHLAAYAGPNRRPGAVTIFGVPGHLVIDNVEAGLHAEALGTDPVRGAPVTLKTYRGELRVRSVTRSSW